MSPARREKWFVQAARVLAWLSAIVYALLWVGRIVYVITHSAEILAWFDRHDLQSLRSPGIFLILPVVPDFVIGISMALLFGFVRAQTQKNEADQTSEPTLTMVPFSTAPSMSESRPATEVSGAQF